MEITDEQIEKAFAGTNFGPDESIEFRRKYLAQSIFKRMCGYSTGRTISCIMSELGFLTNPNGKPIKKAKEWAYHQIFTTGE